MKLSNSSNPPIPNYCRIKKSVYAYVENKAVKTKIKLWTLESLIKSNGKIVKGKSNIKNTNNDNNKTYKCKMKFINVFLSTFFIN